jgi:uncharacterized protein (DUF58 family)
VGRAVSTGLLGGALLLVAAAFGPTPMLVPGAALLCLGIGAAVWVSWAARGARVERRLGVIRTVEDEPVAIALEARTRVAPPPGSELVEPLLADGPQPATGRLVAEVSFPRRGRVRLEPALLRVRDPLGLALREVRSPADELLVLPRIEAVRVGRGGPAPGRLLAAPAAVGMTDGAEVEVDSLREAPAEAPATRIHWPAVARTRVLMERTLVPESDRRPLVLLDASDPESPEALDAAVRAAASLCVWLARTGGCELLLPGDRRPAKVDAALATWPALHARLALVESGGSTPAPARLERAGAILWVAARSPGHAAGVRALGRSLARAGAGERYVVAPGPAGPGTAFAVAGCHGRRLERSYRRAAA